MVRLALLLFCCLPVCAQSYLGTGLPVCYINTEDSLPIASKQNYVNAKITITLNGDTLLRETDVSVRGRGNATWAAYPKKPYNLGVSTLIYAPYCFFCYLSPVMTILAAALMRKKTG